MSDSQFDPSAPHAAAEPVDAARRCRTCILPAAYPGADLDSHGRCAFCREHEAGTYRGLDALGADVREILERRPDRGCDALVGVSGGRDSSYLLHLLKAELGLNVVALFVDHGLVPDVMRENVRGMTSALGVPLVEHRHERLTRCFPSQYAAWLRDPRPHTVSTLCMGCKSTIITSVYEYARRYRAPILMWGWTPFEHAGYKMNLMRARWLPGLVPSYVAGYTREVLRNPALALDPVRAATQWSEFYVFYGPYKPLQDRIQGTTEVRPFAEHVHWREREVERVLQNGYAWRTMDGLASTWRGDCFLAPIRAHLYRSMLGYDDKVVHLSALVRDGQITREEALHRHQCNAVPDDVLETCCRGAGIPVDSVRDAIARWRASPEGRAMTATR